MLASLKDNFDLMHKLILTYEKIFYFFLLQVLMKKIYPNITKLIIQFFFHEDEG